MLAKEVLSVKEIDCLTVDEKEKYFNDLKEECINYPLKKTTIEWIKKCISYIAPILRSYKLELYGQENLPKDNSAVFICNHSNSHDFFTIHEVFRKIGRKVTPFGASDCLNKSTEFLFKLGDVTLIDRSDKDSSVYGLLEFSKKILNGLDGVIFSEGTWNLHPSKLMQPIKAGGTQVSLITGKVMIPTIFEYFEVPYECKKESQLYIKCVVVFGEPISVSYQDNLIEKTKEVQTVMENMRKAVREKFGESCYSFSNDEEGVKCYLNHTYLKKFKAFGFRYDSEHEFRFLLDYGKDNEYCMNENGEFVPGITTNLNKRAKCDKIK